MGFLALTTLQTEVGVQKVLTEASKPFLRSFPSSEAYWAGCLSSQVTRRSQNSSGLPCFSTETFGGRGNSYDALTYHSYGCDDQET